MEQQQRDARELGALLRSHAEADREWQTRGRRELLARMSVAAGKTAPQRHHVALPFLAAALVPLVAAAALWVAVLRAPQPLTVLSAAPRAATMSAAGRVEVRGAADTLSFSDGSTLTLTPGAALRVRTLTADGATVVVERGTVVARIQHRSTTRWSLLAGPYEVEVVGTHFTAEFDPPAQRFSVALHEGAVSIVGPHGRVDLRAGERFDGAVGALAITSASTVTASSRPSAMAPSAPSSSLSSLPAFSDAPPAVASVAPSAVRAGSSLASTEAAQPVALSAPAASAEARSATAAAPTLDWSAAVRAGAFASVIDDALRIGVEPCLASCNAARLEALADAARYSGRPALAERALHALSEREPARRGRIAYVLGTLAEARGDLSTALRSYERAIGAGAMLPDARAARLRLLAKSGGPTARAAAEEYLRLHPDGVGASAARRVLGRDR